MKETRYLAFREIVSAGKTHVFSVDSRHQGGSLGAIKWYGPWRQYCFFPGEAVFNAECLRDITAFCDSLMAARRNS